MQPKSTKSITHVPRAIGAVLALVALTGGIASASPRLAAPVFARAAVAPAQAAFAVDPAFFGATGRSWPQFGRDAGHSGYNPDETTISAANVGRLALLWTFAPPSGGNLTQGISFGDGLLFAQINGALYAVKPASGVPLWSAGTGNPGAGATPIFHDGLVVSGCGTNEATGICAFAAKTGQPVFQQNCSTFACELVSSPGSADGLLLYQWFNGTNYYETESPTSGALISQTTTGNHCAANANGTPAPALDGSVFYTLGCQGSDNHTSVCSFNVQTGAPGWCSEIAAGCGNADTIGVSAAEGKVFANVQSSSCNEQIVAFEARTGVQRWAYTVAPGNGLGVGAPAIAKGVLYDYVGSAGLQAFSAETGTLRWTQSAARGAFGVSVANGVVYSPCATVNAGATVCAMDAATGNILWSNQVPSGSPTTPIILNGVLFADCNAVEFCAYALPASRHR